MHSLDPIMVLVPFLFNCPLLGVTPIRGVTNIGDNHKDEEQKYKHLHSALLYLAMYVSNTIIASVEPNASCAPQCSTIFPFAMRKTDTPVNVTLVPVAGSSMSEPVFVPRKAKRSTN